MNNKKLWIVSRTSESIISTDEGKYEQVIWKNLFSERKIFWYENCTSDKVRFYAHYVQFSVPISNYIIMYSFHILQINQVKCKRVFS